MVSVSARRIKSMRIKDWCKAAGHMIKWYGPHSYIIFYFWGCFIIENGWIVFVLNILSLVVIVKYIDFRKAFV